MNKKRTLAFLVTLLPMLFSSLSGCMKVPETNQDFGPESSLADISSVINSEAPLDLYRIKKGQFVSIDQTQVINTNNISTIYQRYDEVTDYAETADEIDLKFHVEEKEMIKGSWKESSAYPILRLGKSSDPLAKSAGSTASRQNESSLLLTIKTLEKKDADSSVRYTYHNLKTELDRIPVPDSVKARPNCGGVTNCAAGLRVLKISFDRVAWVNEVPTKTTIRFSFSQDIPPYIEDWSNANDLRFSNRLQACLQTWIEVSDGTNTQNVPLLQCLDVRDFKFGQ